MWPTIPTNKLRSNLPLLVVGLALLQPAQAADDWLLSMSQAVRARNYQGVLVYATGGEMRSLRIVHRFQNGREQERLQSLTGEAREVLRDNEIVTCIHPKNQRVMVDRRELQGLFKSVTDLASFELEPYYEIREEPSAQLIERSCRVVVLAPRDAYRYGYRIWADEQTALPLRIELLGPGNTLVEQIMFTQIEYPESIPDKALLPAVDPAKFEWTRVGSQDGVILGATTGGQWQVRRLPPGFRLVGHQRRQLPEQRLPTEHLLFSDGLTSVSVFVAPEGEGPSRFKGISQMGAVHAYGRSLDRHHISVVGEVPRATVELIGNALEREATAAAAAPP